MLAPSKAAALAWLGAQPGDSAAQAAALAPLTDLQFKALQLYLISLLPGWGKLVYVMWVHVGQPGPGKGGIVVKRSVYDLMYGGWLGGVGGCCMCCNNLKGGNGTCFGKTERDAAGAALLLHVARHATLVC
jgi:hypothetical protein